MGDFSCGVLFMTPQTEQVEQATGQLKEPFYIRTINEKWSGFFSEETDHRIMPAPWTIDLAQRLPLLTLSVAEDIGWNYKMLKAGQIVAHLDIIYSLDWHMAYEIAKERYADYGRDLMDAIAYGHIPFGDIQDEVRASAAYRHEVAQFFAHMNLPELAIFDISPEAIAELSSILTVENYLADHFEQEYAFKRCMDLREFSYLSYDHLRRREEQGDV